MGGGQVSACNSTLLSGGAPVETGADWTLLNETMPGRQGGASSRSSAFFDFS
jgi:hypothetical protein